MKRTTRFKIMSVTFSLFIIFLAIDLYKAYKSPLLLLSPILLLIIVNIITKVLWKKFYEGRKLIQKKEYAQALEKYESFFRDIESKPFLTYLMYLTFRIYTQNLKAVVYNNIASCHINLLQLKKAKEAVTQSLHEDELYAVPYYNLAIINVLEEKSKNAKKHLEKANELGFRTINFQAFENYIKKVYNVSPKSEN